MTHPMLTRARRHLLAASERLAMYRRMEPLNYGDRLDMKEAEQEYLFALDHAWEVQCMFGDADGH